MTTSQSPPADTQTSSRQRPATALDALDPLPTLAARAGRTVRLALAAVAARQRAPAMRPQAPESAVKGLLAMPYADVGDAHRRLFALRNHFAAQGDRRAVFLTIYARMTGAVGAFIDRGEFRDPAWVADYLVTFANHYRRAALDWELGRVDALPTAWHLAFAAADRGDSLVIQDAMLGVNAHINCDLALTLAEVGTTPDRAAKQADHDAVMAVIRGLTDHAQAALAERDAAGIAAADAALGGVDEWLTVVAIDRCRDSAWRTALALSSPFPPRRALARWLNAVTATGGARLILAPRSNGRLHTALRRLERGRR